MAELGEDAALDLDAISCRSSVQFDELDLPRFFGVGAALYSALTIGLYPLHSSKTRAQAAGAKPGGGLRQVLAPGAYKGLGVAVTGALPARVGYIFALEAGAQSATSLLQSRGVRPETAASMGGALGGAAAAATSMLIYIPFDIISQQQIVAQQQSTSTRAANESGLTIARRIVSESGVRGLYRGFGITVITYLPSSALWWGTYKATREAIERSSPRTSALVVEVASGAVAGALTSTVTMPLDTIKTRTQTQGANGGKQHGFVRVTRELLVSGGASSLWRGVFWRCAHTVVWGCTMVVAYEQLKRWAAKPSAKARSATI